MSSIRIDIFNVHNASPATVVGESAASQNWLDQFFGTSVDKLIDSTIGFVFSIDGVMTRASIVDDHSNYNVKTPSWQVYSNGEFAHYPMTVSATYSNSISSYTISVPPEIDVLLANLDFVEYVYKTPDRPTNTYLQWKAGYPTYYWEITVGGPSTTSAMWIYKDGVLLCDSGAGNVDPDDEFMFRMSIGGSVPDIFWTNRVLCEEL